MLLEAPALSLGSAFPAGSIPITSCIHTSTMAWPLTHSPSVLGENRIQALLCAAQTCHATLHHPPQASLGMLFTS